MITENNKLECNNCLIDMENKFGKIHSRLAAIDTTLENHEKSINKLDKLITTVSELAVSMNHMAIEQQNQGKKLESIMALPGKIWWAVIAAAISGGLGALIGMIVK